MNLWAKTTLRQLAILSVALFFFSCEDESSILGFKNPNKKFQVGYVDIDLNTNRLLAFDSAITDLRPLNTNNFVDGVFVGEYLDPEFGKISARSFLSLYSTSNAAFASTAVYDSITIQLRLNFYGYGFSGVKEKRIAIHEITGDTLTTWGGKRYYASSPAPEYSVAPIGEATVTVNYDSLLKQASLSSGQDTLLAYAKLSDEFGARVFDAIKAGVTSEDAIRLFKNQIKGLALVPAESDGVLGFNVVNSFGQQSRVLLHYHTLTDDGAVDDTLARAFGFDFAGFTKIDAERTGTDLSTLQPYQSAEPASDKLFVQSGAPVTTAIDFNPFYAFADTMDNILVNAAEFIIDGVSAPEGMKPHTAFMFRMVTEPADKFLTTRVATDVEYAVKYYVTAGSSESNLPPWTTDYLLAEGDNGFPVTIAYNSETSRYSGFMTRFVQSLLANSKDAGVVNEARLRYLSLFPLQPTADRAVTRTLFDTNNVKLRIYYTRANSINP